MMRSLHATTHQAEWMSELRRQARKTDRTPQKQPREDRRAGKSKGAALSLHVLRSLPNRHTLTMGISLARTHMLLTLSLSYITCRMGNCRHSHHLDFTHVHNLNQCKLSKIIFQLHNMYIPSSPLEQNCSSAKCAPLLFLDSHAHFHASHVQPWRT